MGLDRNGSKFLIFAKSLGVDYSETATIGRQGLHLSIRDLEKSLSSFKREFDKLGKLNLISLFQDYQGYAEGLFYYLGAKKVESFDYSDYEGATHTHDMNYPLPDQYKQLYTTVVDGGSLEHIFNFPTAVKNCMEMVKINGHFISITPCNNFPGHGLYQFSPDLFFRIFSEENGFQVKKVILFEDDWEKDDVTWYEVIDPSHTGEQVTFTSRKPTLLMILAKRVKETPIFVTPPQQSFYTSTWNEVTNNDKCFTPNFSQSPINVTGNIKKIIPDPFKSLLKKGIIFLMCNHSLPPPKKCLEPLIFGSDRGGGYERLLWNKLMTRPNDHSYF